MLSVRLNSIESTDTNRTNQLKFVATFSELGRFMYRYFTDLDLRWTMQGGLKMLSIQLDSIKLTRIVSPVVDSSCQKLTCESSRMVKYLRRIDLVWVYWTWMLIRPGEILESVARSLFTMKQHTIANVYLYLSFLLWIIFIKNILLQISFNI